MFKTVLIMVAALMLGKAYACDIHGKTGIVEENNLWIGTEEKGLETITELQFNTVIDKVIGLYEDEVADRGAVLKVIRNWTDGTVNAYAKQENGEYQVHMYGGLARHETITEDGFALVVCHELGHHLGGAPKKVNSMGVIRWASSEGQSDYWGTMKCFRKYLESEDNNAWLRRVGVSNIEPTLKKACASSYGQRGASYTGCLRAGMGGMSVASLFNALRNITTPVKFSTPDTAVVTQNYHRHPMPQCRLDTYFAGSVCDKKVYEQVSDTDAKPGVCNRSEGAPRGVRPLCWYKPSANK